MKNKEDWIQYSSHLHICDADYLKAQGFFAVDEPLLTRLKEQVVKEGYFELPPLSWDLPIDEMATTVQRFRTENIPVVFSFVYDEFWLIFYRLHAIIRHLLGDYLKLPDFWVWHVDPEKDESGWSPHRDKTRLTLNHDGSPNALTIWLPLTDANPLNGCMYILPADRDPVYNTPEERNWKINFPDIRALPGRPGAVFGWNQAVLHWGSKSSKRAVNPRISIALEFQSEDRQPLNQPLMKPGYFPSLDERLRLIAKQMLQYQHMYPIAVEHAEWAKDTINRQVIS